MISLRKKLLVHREILTSELENEEHAYQQVKTDLLDFHNHNVFTIAALMIPVFLWGWQKNRKKELGRSVSNSLKWGLRSLLFLIKKHYLLKLL